MRYLVGFLCCSLFSLSALAMPQPIERKHNLGVIVGVGRVNISDELSTDELVANVGGYYEYQLNNRLAFQFAALDGDGQCFITCGSSDDYITYTSYQLSLKTMTQFSGRWNLFGRAGADFYRVTYKPDRSYIYFGDNYTSDYERKTISGTKAVLALGGQFRPKNGFSLNIELQYLPLSLGNIYTVNAFAGYSF